MTNMMTAQGSATSTRIGMAPDDLTSPPFAALQQLAAARCELDETISTLIGQLQPYVDDSGIAGLVLKGESTPTVGASALERRIVAETDVLRELHARLSETARLLRL